MKKTVIAMIAGPLTFFGGAACADTFSPGGHLFYFDGSVSVGPPEVTIDCDGAITIQSDMDGKDAKIISFTLSGGLAGLMSIGGLPWNLDVQAPVPPPTGATATTLKIKGMQGTSIFGSICGPGDVVVSWSPAVITFPVGTILNPGGCRIDGVLLQSGGPPLVITN